MLCAGGEGNVLCARGDYRNNPLPNHGIRRILPWFEAIEWFIASNHGKILRIPWFGRGIIPIVT